MAYILRDILQKGIQKGVVPAKEAEARTWYRERARKTRQLNNQSLFDSAVVRGSVMPGYMFMFTYDPKEKNKLPYYDTFPLVFPFKRDSKGFMGINLHYLPKTYRALLMDALYDTASDDNFDEKTRLRISYTILNNASKFSYFKPCIKQYLYSHVKSRYILIPSNEWDIALFLPTENFVKASTQKVHRDSVKKING